MQTLYVKGPKEVERASLEESLPILFFLPSGIPLLPYPMKVLYGGDNKRLHSIAQEKVWTETLKFLRQYLCS